MVAPDQIDFRDVVTVDPRYLDQENPYSRPVLVISKKDFHKNTGFMIGIGITTSREKKPNLIPISNIDLEEGRFDSYSQVMLHRVAYAKIVELDSRMGKVKLDFYKKLTSELRKVIEV